MTPIEFKNVMDEIKDNDDTECSHIWADSIMCQVLSELGYTDGVEVFEGMDRWYS